MTLMQLLADLTAQGGSVSDARELHKRASKLPDAGAPHLVSWVKMKDVQGPERA